jgi:hypothetical protein
VKSSVQHPNTDLGYSKLENIRHFLWIFEKIGKKHTAFKFQVSTKKAAGSKFRTGSAKRKVEKWEGAAVAGRFVACR